ncbi:hypothetical protein [Acinetobacter equi]|uniref:Uncharacterized protein n=1 Tax=Acinetobacter equi TaxID=1324350 RepID=A0A0N9W0M2_9GAMM|nr:hypothetical protein [Acinetobacter equi]ALH94564.1 hypothetical protein AOY20_02870 [Acinetobacter equi]
MKKVYILLLVLSLAWMIKLSFDVSKMSTQQQNVMQDLHQLENSNSNLNDQMVALQRPDYDVKEVKTIQIQEEKANNDALTRDLIKQQLTLIEFALKQNKPYYALDKIITLGQQLNAYPISIELKDSLEKAIDKDINILKQYVATQDEQNQMIQKVLQQVDLELTLESTNRTLTPAQTQEDHFWRKWLSIESVNKPAKQLTQRPLIMKEAQLRLIMARQILLNDQYNQYQIELNEIIILLQQLPDQKTQKIIKQLENLKKVNKISIPKLTTRTLVG